MEPLIVILGLLSLALSVLLKRAVDRINQLAQAVNILISANEKLADKVRELKETK